MDNLIVLDNITKIYKVPKRHEGRFRFIKNLTLPEYNKVVAVRDLSMLISHGERVGYIGPNGAGKSTTIKMLMGILMPTQGNISVFARIPCKNRKFLSSQIGVVFGQKSQLWWDVPVIESYRLLKEIYRISDVQFRENIDFYQTLFDIGDLLHTPVRQLSLGQRMRCDIVAALLHNPRILLLDEPTIGLDVNIKDKIRKFILKLNREKNLTVFLTTHDMKDVEELCKRIVLIDKGEKIFDGSNEALKDKYITRRLLRVKFLNHIEISDLYNLLGTVQSEIGIRMMDDLYEFNFIQKTVSVSEVIRLLQSRYEVTDFSTVEPNIEDVIKKLC